jgi:PTH2 family peptidyl-tRNA hydrolase
MKLAMYLFVNNSLNMSPGKMAAQVAHAAVRASRLSNELIVENWLNNGECKLVMSARNEEELKRIKEYLTNCKLINSVLIYDEGLTELNGTEITALGVEIVDRELKEVQNALGHFKLYKPKIKVNLEFDL